MKLSQFQFNLPSDRIATEPPRWRDECKLMVLNKKTGEIERLFRENGAGWLYAKSHVVLFVITNSILTVLRALGLSLFIKKIKFRLTKKF